MEREALYDKEGKMEVTRAIIATSTMMLAVTEAASSGQLCAGCRTNQWAPHGTCTWSVL